MSPPSRYRYLFCSDLDGMRAFYRGLVGLEESPEHDDEGSVTYRFGPWELAVVVHPEARPGDGAWSVQPGWTGGARPVVSCSVELDEDRFRAAVDRLTGAEVPAFGERPHWDGGWRFPVMDPMGNPVELIWAPDVEPAERIWPAADQDDTTPAPVA